MLLGGCCQVRRVWCIGVLAAVLLSGEVAGAANGKAQRAETKIRLQDAINSMDPIDREVLALRHFEELSNAEAAEVLEIGRAHV